MDEADLLFQLDGDADIMKYITHGIPRTMDEVIEKVNAQDIEILSRQIKILNFLQHI